jgi:CPA1 family monovalent cation:H+ antiporter
MTTFDYGAALLIIAAAIGIVNERTLRLPAPVALLLGSMFVLSCLVLTDLTAGTFFRDHLRQRISNAHLPQVLLDGLLALLLFAGSLQVDLPDLRRRFFTVFLLATGSVVLATAVFAVGLWGALKLIGAPIPFGWCLVIGAILAPTDAVAVEGLLKRARLPAGLRTIIAGESLFNDGAAVVLFATSLALIGGHRELIGHGRLAEAILLEGGGGVLLGASAGYLAYRLIRFTKDGNLTLTISLALALSTYRGAIALDISGPIAVVTAGITLGTLLSGAAPEDEWRSSLFRFWPFLDETLNTLLYILIGFEVIALDLAPAAFLVIAIAIPLALLARLLSVIVPLLVMRVPHMARATSILTWAGLRGGVSIALVLILPETPYRNLLVVICFGVVIFTVVVQGLLLPRIVAVLYKPSRQSIA